VPERDTAVYAAGRAHWRPGGQRVASVGCRGSDHRPAVGIEDRLGAEEPRNQGKNVSCFSHGSLPLHIRQPMRKGPAGIYLALASRPDGEYNSGHGAFSVITCEDRVGF
jgi:hypothetical protein